MRLGAFRDRHQLSLEVCFGTGLQYNKNLGDKIIENEITQHGKTIGSLNNLREVKN